MKKLPAKSMRKLQHCISVQLKCANSQGYTQIASYVKKKLLSFELTLIFSFYRRFFKKKSVKSNLMYKREGNIRNIKIVNIMALCLIVNYAFSVTWTT